MADVEPPRTEQANGRTATPGGSNSSQAPPGDGRTNDRVNGPSGSGPVPTTALPNPNNQPPANNMLNGANAVDEIPLVFQNPFPQAAPLARGITIPRVLMYVAGTLTVIALFGICLYIQREYYIRQLMKHAPSPSPFSYEDSADARKPVEEEPEQDVISIKYEPPSEVLQKIPFLKKSEEEIYADQMKQVMWSLREAVKRMDRGGNETQLAGVITMKPNDKPGNEINVNGIDPVTGEEIGSDPKAESSSVVKDLVKRLTNALSEASGKKDLSSQEDEVESSEDSVTFEESTNDESGQTDEHPIEAILNYRKKYFKRDQELAKLLADPASSRNQKLIDEADKRDEIRRKLILNLVDHFFATETDDDARIEKAYHYAMTDAEKYERQVRLETEIFGPENLEGGRDVVFGTYRKQMGYIYDESLKTYINGSEVVKLKKLEAHQKKGFYSEMRILLKLERRIKAKVVKYAKHQRIEL